MPSDDGICVFGVGKIGENRMTLLFQLGLSILVKNFSSAIWAREGRLVDEF